MLLALLALALVAVVLAAPFTLRVAGVLVCRARAHWRSRSPVGHDLPDPGRERRAEQRARELLRSCVSEEEWAMYRDLGFIRIRGSSPDRRDGGGEADDALYAYLIYPHKPIVAYVPKTGRLLSEYCVEFPDLTGAILDSRLPDSDDVLAKWMALTGDERGLVRTANMHLPGRRLDPTRVRRDLWRLSEWERQRRGSNPERSGKAGSL